ncbi:MAG: PAS domain S-box protein [Myxococcota bacterium]|nr:PAS domain S-box protein [Myxococcota bacterium]
MTRERAQNSAEAALLGDALRARAIGTRSPFLIHELDEKRRAVFASPNHERITGQPSTDLIGSDWIAFLHPDDADTVQAAFERAASNGSAHMLVRGRTRTNGWPWFDCFLVSFRGASDEPRTLAVSRDVTELRDHWERFRLIRETSLDLVSEMDREGIIRFASGSHENELGLRPAELVGSPLLELMHPDDTERIATALRLRQPGERMRGRFRVRDGKGSWRWIDCTATTYEAEGGLRILGVSRDVTESVALEQALRESQERAQLLVTRQEDEREAERARVAREIHDELGQGLTGLRLQLGARSEGAEGEAAKEAMLAQIDHLLEAVRRIGARMLPPSLEQFGLVAAIESQARSLADAAGWRLRTELDSRETGLDGRQQSAVFRVAQEALTNVARHAGASEVEVRLETLEGRLQLLVRDDGRGIPAECVTSPRSSGIGGMRARAASLGATLEIEGAHQEGTVVKLEMPNGDPPDVAENEP